MPLFQVGFRPFFMLAGLMAGASMLLWVHALRGGTLPGGHFDFVSWHTHEMIYGYGMAVVAGFLLTAIPNWTGRMPLRGPALVCLVGLWLAGRLAVGFSDILGAEATVALDLGFPVVFCAVVLREILAGSNWRNLPMVIALAAFTVGSALMHWSAVGGDIPPDLGARLGLSVLIMLIVLVGGRIVPSFTRNWLAKRDAQRLPASFGTIDRLALISALVGLLTYTIAPDHWGILPAAGLASVLLLLRLARWRGIDTFSNPLLLILHVGYGWVPIGFALLAASTVWPGMIGTAAIHAFAAGAVGTMTLAVMTRATLGHSGQPLEADKATCAIYLAVNASAVLRIAAELRPEAMTMLLAASGVLWSFAFLGFFLAYARYFLFKPKSSIM